MLMDSATNFLVSALSGVAGNIITTLLPRSGLEEEKEPYSDSVKRLVGEKLQSFSYSLDWEGELPVEEICLLIQRKEFEQILSQLFAFRVLDRKSMLEGIEETEIKKQLETVFKFWFPNHVAGDLELFYEILDQTIDIFTVKFLNEAIVGSTGIEMGFVIKLNRMGNLLLGVEKNLQFLTSGKIATVETIKDYGINYRNISSKILGRVGINNLNRAEKVEIDKLYVSPIVKEHFCERLYGFRKYPVIQPRVLVKSVTQDFSPIPEIELLHDGLASPDYFAEGFDGVPFDPSRDSLSEPEPMASTVENDDFSAKIGWSRIVLLGNPGGGKTSLTRKLVWDICQNDSGVTPFHITLRDFAFQRENTNCSILEYIEISSNRDYQLKPPKGAVEYLLRNGLAVVVFDGLDELLATGNRNQIVEVIEAFCESYPTTGILVTSRKVGYREAPLGDDFDVYELAGFKEEQVSEYARKFFALDRLISSDAAEEKAVRFLYESESVQDLRSNPLMLGLMCSIYKYENYIPQNRPEVYQRCSTMLFEKWDSSRGIEVNIDFREHLMPGLMYLALWIFESPRLSNGVHQDELISKITNYLDDYYPNRNVARQVAVDFVEFCRGRAWVFSELGDGVYKFSHQTFLEYFAALQIASETVSPTKSVNRLAPKIAKGEWDVVAQLVLHIVSKQVHKGTDKIIERLLLKIATTYKNKMAESINTLDFLSRILLYFSPSTRTLNKYLQTLVDYLFELSRHQGVLTATQSSDEQTAFLNTNNLTYNVFALLKSVLDANQATVRNNAGALLSKILICKIEKVEKKDRLSTVMNLAELFSSFKVNLDDDLNDFKQLFLRQIDSFDETKISIASLKFRAALISLHDCFGLHGFSFLWYYDRSSFVQNSEQVEIHSQGRGSAFFSILKKPDLINDDLNLQKIVSIVEKTFLENSFAKQPPMLEVFKSDEFIQLRLDSVASSNIFGYLILWLVHVEMFIINKNREDIKTYQKDAMLLSYIDEFNYHLLTARYDKGISALLSQLIEKLGFTKDQKSLLEKWTSHEITFLFGNVVPLPDSLRELSDALD